MTFSIYGKIKYVPNHPPDTVQQLNYFMDVHGSFHQKHFK
jgi:hypothetical protein